MAIEDNSNMIMPVAPANNGFGGFGDGGWWFLLLFILLGGNGFGGFGGGNEFYPWMNQADQISNGFRDQTINASIGGIQAGIADLQNALYGTQMADMERNFALQSQFSQCCCDNRSAIADLKYTVATEACADRAAVKDALRDVLEATQAQTQVIIDKMCQQEIDALKSQNIALQNQVNMLNLAASQTAQTAEIISKLPASTTA